MLKPVASDDCALLNIPEKQTAISTDTLVAGIHFYPISILPIWRAARSAGGEFKRSGGDGRRSGMLTLALTRLYVDSACLPRSLGQPV